MGSITPTQNITVVGNGPIASSILKALRKNPHYALTNLTYETQSASALTSQSHSDSDTHSHADDANHDHHEPQIKHLPIPFTPSNLTTALSQTQVLISTLTSPSPEPHSLLTTAAHTAGVRVYIPCPSHPPPAPSCSPSKAPPTLHLNLGLILDHALHTGTFGISIPWSSATILAAPDTLIPVSSLARVGRAVAALVSRRLENPLGSPPRSPPGLPTGSPTGLPPEFLQQKEFFLPALHTSQADVIASLERITGQAYTIGHISLEDARREARVRIERGYPDAGRALLERCRWFDGEREARQDQRQDPDQHQDGSQESDAANALLGLERESLDDIVRSAAETWRRESEAQGADCGCG